MAEYKPQNEPVRRATEAAEQAAGKVTELGTAVARHVTRQEEVAILGAEAAARPVTTQAREVMPMLERADERRALRIIRSDLSSLNQVFSDYPEARRLFAARLNAISENLQSADENVRHDAVFSANFHHNRLQKFKEAITTMKTVEQGLRDALAQSSISGEPREKIGRALDELAKTRKEIEENFLKFAADPSQKTENFLKICGDKEKKFYETAKAIEEGILNSDNYEQTARRTRQRLEIQLNELKRLQTATSRGSEEGSAKEKLKQIDVLVHKYELVMKNLDVMISGKYDPLSFGNANSATMRMLGTSLALQDGFDQTLDAIYAMSYRELLSEKGLRYLTGSAGGFSYEQQLRVLNAALKHNENTALDLRAGKGPMVVETMAAEENGKKVLKPVLSEGKPKMRALFERKALDEFAEDREETIKELRKAKALLEQVIRRGGIRNTSEMSAVYDACQDARSADREAEENYAKLFSTAYENHTISEENKTRQTHQKIGAWAERNAWLLADGVVMGVGIAAEVVSLGAATPLVVAGESAYWTGRGAMTIAFDYAARGEFSVGGVLGGLMMAVPGIGKLAVKELAAAGKIAAAERVGAVTGIVGVAMVGHGFYNIGSLIASGAKYGVWSPEAIATEVIFAGLGARGMISHAKSISRLYEAIARGSRKTKVENPVAVAEQKVAQLHTALEEQFVRNKAVGIKSNIIKEWAGSGERKLGLGEEMLPRERLAFDYTKAKENLDRLNAGKTAEAPPLTAEQRARAIANERQIAEQQAQRARAAEPTRDAGVIDTIASTIPRDNARIIIESSANRMYVDSDGRILAAGDNKGLSAQERSAAIEITLTRDSRNRIIGIEGLDGLKAEQAQEYFREGLKVANERIAAQYEKETGMQVLTWGEAPKGMKERELAMGGMTANEVARQSANVLAVNNNISILTGNAYRESITNRTVGVGGTRQRVWVDSDGKIVAMGYNEQMASTGHHEITIKHQDISQIITDIYGLENLSESARRNFVSAVEAANKKYIEDFHNYPENIARVAFPRNFKLAEPYSEARQPAATFPEMARGKPEVNTRTAEQRAKAEEVHEPITAEMTASEKHNIAREAARNLVKEYWQRGGKAAEREGVAAKLEAYAKEAGEKAAKLEKDSDIEQLRSMFRELNREIDKLDETPGNEKRISELEKKQDDINNRITVLREAEKWRSLESDLIREADGFRGKAGEIVVPEGKERIAALEAQADKLAVRADKLEQAGWSDEALILGRYAEYLRGEANKLKAQVAAAEQRVTQAEAALKKQLRQAGAVGDMEGVVAKWLGNAEEKTRRGEKLAPHEILAVDNAKAKADLERLKAAEQTASSESAQERATFPKEKASGEKPKTKEEEPQYEDFGDLADLADSTETSAKPTGTTRKPMIETEKPVEISQPIRTDQANIKAEIDLFEAKDITSRRNQYQRFLASDEKTQNSVISYLFNVGDHEFSVALAEIRSVAALEKRVGMKAGELTRFYIEVPGMPNEITNLSSARSFVLARLRQDIKTIKIDISSYLSAEQYKTPFTNLYELLSSNILDNIERALPRGSEVKEITYYSGITGTYRLRIETPQGERVFFLIPNDPRAAEFGAIIGRKAGVPTPEVITEIGGRSLESIGPTGNKKTWGISVDIRTFEGELEIAGREIPFDTMTAERLSNMEQNVRFRAMLNDAEGQRVIGEEAGYTLAGTTAIGMYDSHDSNLFAMLLRLKGENAKKDAAFLRERGYKVFEDAEGFYIFKIGRIDTDTGGSFKALKIGDDYNFSAMFDEVGGRNLKDVVNSLADKFGQTKEETMNMLTPYLRTGAERWVRDVGSRKEFQDAMVKHFESHDGKPVGVGRSFDADELEMVEGSPVKQITDPGKPFNGRSDTVRNADGRSDFIAIDAIDTFNWFRQQYINDNFRSALNEILKRCRSRLGLSEQQKTARNP